MRVEPVSQQPQEQKFRHSWYNTFMDVADLVKKANKEANQDVMFYNPSSEDFTVVYHNNSLIIPALRISTFKKPVADHIKKHLVTEILNKKGVQHTEKRIKEIYKKLEDFNETES